MPTLDDAFLKHEIDTAKRRLAGEVRDLREALDKIDRALATDKVFLGDPIGATVTRLLLDLGAWQALAGTYSDGRRKE